MLQRLGRDCTWPTLQAKIDAPHPLEQAWHDLLRLLWCGLLFSPCMRLSCSDPQVADTPAYLRQLLNLLCTPEPLLAKMGYADHMLNWLPDQLAFNTRVLFGPEGGLPENVQTKAKDCCNKVYASIILPVFKCTPYILPQDISCTSLFCISSCFWQNLPSRCQSQRICECYEHSS